MTIPRESYLAKAYEGQLWKCPDYWAHSILNGEVVSLYGPEIVQKYFTEAIVRYVDLERLKTVNIFDIGAGDGRVAKEIGLSLKSLRPIFTLLEPSLSDPNSIIYQKYYKELYNPSHNIIPKKLEDFQPWVDFNQNSQDVVMSMFVIQYLANPQRVKLLLETQYKLLKPGGIAINLWVGANTQEESDWMSELWLEFDRIRDPNVSNNSIKLLRKNWNQFDIEGFKTLILNTDFKIIKPTTDIKELQKWYNIEALTNGSRFKKIEIQSQINSMRSRLNNIQELYPEQIINSSIRLPIIHSILQKPKIDK
jgi:SAM-dependent methyltransferase